MNNLNFNTTSLRIAYRTTMMLIERETTSEGFRDSLVESKSPWRLYSKHHGVYKPETLGYPTYAEPELNSKINSLKKRHPSREYKIIEVHETRQVRDFEQNPQHQET